MAKNVIFHHDCDNVFKDKVFQLRVMPIHQRGFFERWHSHADFYELVICVSGTAVQDTGVRKIVCQPGYIFLLAPGSKHCYREANDFSYYNVLFTFALMAPFLPLLSSFQNYRRLFGNGESSDNLSDPLYADTHGMMKIMDSILTLQQELLTQSECYQEICQLKLLDLLQFILRIAKNKIEVTSTVTEQIIKTQKIMSEKCEANYTLEKLAKIANMSLTTYRRHFRAMTQCTPMEFLIRQRLKKAVVMLTMTQSIENIAVSAGFCDASYFTKIFKRHVGFTPYEFRKQYQIMGESAQAALLNWLDQ